MAWLLGVGLAVEGCSVLVHWRCRLALVKDNTWRCDPCHHNCSTDPLERRLGCSKRRWPALGVVLEVVEDDVPPTSGAVVAHPARAVGEVAPHVGEMSYHPPR
jgi:hypothetical protein